MLDRREWRLGARPTGNRVRVTNMTRPMPPDPLTELMKGAAHAHEMYRAYVDAGFTEEQALRLIIAMIASMAANMNGGS